MKLAHFRYTVQKERVPRLRWRDAVTDAHLVVTNGFGYLKNDPRILATVSIGCCIGVFLKISEQKFRGLSHLSSSLDHFLTVVGMLSYLINRGLIVKVDEFDDAQIITNFTSSRTAIRRTYSAFRLFGINSRVMRYTWPSPVAYLFDQNGALSLGGTKLDGHSALSSYTRHRKGILVCENTGETIGGGEKPFEIYPGIPSVVYRINGNRPVFSIQFPIQGEVDPRILAEVELEYIRTRLERCEHGNYIRVSTQHPGNFGIKAVEDAAFAIAARLAGFD